jgi:hypothetical protein
MRRDGGSVRPRAWAVLRLITSANRMGCSTGRSAGLAPFRILSTEDRWVGCYGHDDVHWETNQLGRKLERTVESPLCPPILNDDVLALEPAMVAQPLPEGLEDRRIYGRRDAA